MASSTGRCLGVNGAIRLGEECLSLSRAAGQPEPNSVSSSVRRGESSARLTGLCTLVSLPIGSLCGRGDQPVPGDGAARGGLFLQLPAVVLAGLFCL